MVISEFSVPERTLLVGCGRVGTQLGEQLVAAGSQVYALRRNPNQLPSSFTQLAVDLLQPVPDTLPAVDAMVITLTPTMQDSSGGNGYLQAVQHLAKALPKVPARVVFVSSPRVFEGYTGSRPITEADPVTPISQRGETLVAAEHQATDLFGAHILRPAGIYGPGREMLIRKVLERQPVQYARRTNRIHQTDLVQALRAMLALADPPEVLHAIDQTPGVLLGDVVNYIANKLDMTPPPALEPVEDSGKTLNGDRLNTLIGPLTYPTYRAGYDNIIEAREQHG